MTSSNWPSYLRPNQPVPAETMRYIMLGWLGGLALLWIFSPFTFLPQPADVILALEDLWSNENLGQQLLTSFTLNLEALLTSLVLSLGLSYAATLPVCRPVIMAVGKLRFLSMVGLSFAFTVMTSSGHGLKLAMLTFSITVFFVTGMADVISQIPQEQYDLARTLRMGDWEVLWEVVILGTADQAWVVLRQNAAIGWMMLSMIESMERSEGGIGALLATSDKYMHLAAVMGIQIMVLGMGLGQDYSLAWLRGVCCPYADLGRKRG